MKLLMLITILVCFVALCQTKKKKSSPNNVKDFLRTLNKSNHSKSNTNSNAAFTRGTEEKDKQSEKYETFGFESEEIVPFTQSCGRQADDDDEKEDEKESNTREFKYTKLESCCLTHRNCPLTINTNRSRWGVTNNVAYTIYDCKCDDAYASCLRNIKKTSGFFESGVAWLVGKGYFDVYKTPCLKIPDGVNINEEEKPIAKNNGGQGPDAAYDMPNNDNKPKAKLRPPTSYTNGKKKTV